MTKISSFQLLESQVTSHPAPTEYCRLRAHSSAVLQSLSFYFLDSFKDLASSDFHPV